MREHEYRGKEIESGKWRYGSLIVCGATDKTYIFEKGHSANESEKVGEEGCLSILTFEVIPETVGQFTGENYCNGKRIYEGDIVTYKGIGLPSKGIIEYEAGGFVVAYAWSLTKKLYWKHLFEENEEHQLKGIGNIHDNPKLLKQVK